MSSTEALGDKSPPESALAGKTGFSRPIGTGNEQGMEFPVTLGLRPRCLRHAPLSQSGCGEPQEVAPRKIWGRVACYLLERFVFGVHNARAYQ